MELAVKMNTRNSALIFHKLTPEAHNLKPKEGELVKVYCGITLPFYRAKERVKIDDPRNCAECTRVCDENLPDQCTFVIYEELK